LGTAAAAAQNIGVTSARIQLLKCRKRIVEPLHFIRIVTLHACVH
jgi:hypothetical protein